MDRMSAPDHDPPTRRRWLSRAGAGLLAVAATSGRGQAQRRAEAAPATLYTFGDSILDCGGYNDRGIDPGRLLVRNDDALFPEFRGRDLVSRRGAPVRLVHRALDGATSADLQRQLPGRADLVAGEAATALVTIGGNDLLRGLAAEPDARGVRRFAETLERFVAALPVRPVVLGTVYDPTFGDDRRNFLGVPPAIARAALGRVNDAIRAVALRHGRVADLHAHFLRGDASWFTNTIEPSLRGASEVRRVFLDAI
jgi:acyl-CoA thioesterase-1